jgi:hypothetical protein
MAKKPNPLVDSQNWSVNAAQYDFEDKLDAARRKRNLVRMELLTEKLRQVGRNSEAFDVRRIYYADYRLGLDPSKNQILRDKFVDARMSLPWPARPHEIWPLPQDVPAFLNGRCWKNFINIVSKWPSNIEIGDYRMLFLTINREPWGKIVTHSQIVAGIRDEVLRSLRPHKVWSGWFFDVGHKTGSRYPHFHMLVVVPVEREQAVEAIIDGELADIAALNRVQIHVAYPDRAKGERDGLLRTVPRRQAAWFVVAAYVAGILRRREVPRNRGRTPQAGPVSLDGYWEDIPVWPHAWRAASISAALMTPFEKALFPFLVLDWMKRLYGKKRRRQFLTAWTDVRPLKSPRTRRPRSIKKSTHSASYRPKGNTVVVKGNKAQNSPQKRGRTPIAISKRRIVSALAKYNTITAAARSLGVAINTFKRIKLQHGL